MKNIIIILFLISTFHLTSQEWTNYDLNELNLEYIDLYDLDLDTKGDLWLASLRGLIKFDGQNWTHFDTINSDLPQNQLFSVEIDNYDNVWMGYQGGSIDSLTIYDGQSWIDYNKNNSAYSLSIISDIIFDKNENAWFAVDNFLWTLQNGNWMQIKHNKVEDNSIYANVSEVEVDMNNDIWFTSRFEGLFKYSNGELSNYTHINPYSYDGLAIDSNNNAWAVNSQNSLMNYNTGTKQWKVRDTNETPISSGFNIEHTIIVDRNNTLWIAERQSLHNFNPATEEWITYNPPQNLLDSMQGGFRDMKLDANGDFWLITWSYDGVFKLSGVITDVNDNEAQSPNINIYPNPTTSQLQFDYDNTQPITEYRIINSEGKEMLKNQSINSNTINISSLSKGVYFLELTIIKGTKLSKKFVVE